MQDNRKDLETERYLLRVIDQLPHTVKDAISLTDSIGQRYLWVDRLCIIQDDLDDRASQIAAMGRIYSLATLTIAAITGDNANAGLSGMSAGPRNFQQHTTKVQGMYLANRPQKFSRAVNNSMWDTRAWTLQEKIMSPRILFVGSQRCFFTCHCQEDVCLESADTTENGLGRIRAPISGDRLGGLLPSSRYVNILSYRKLVEAYTSRQLTKPADILNAFKGLEACLRPIFRSDFVFGLPRSELDSQLLWQPTKTLSRRLHPDTGLPLFPSWSWTGLVGEMQCNRNKHLSRIDRVESNGERFSPRDFRDPAGAHTDGMKRIEHRLKWRGAVYIYNGVPYYYERKNPDEWFLHPTAPEEQRIPGPKVKGMTDHLVFEAETTDSHNISLEHYWAKVIDRCVEEKHQLCPLQLLDPDGFLGGYVKVAGETFNRFRDDIVNGCFLPNEYEFVMLSRGKLLEQKIVEKATQIYWLIRRQLRWRKSISPIG